MEQLKKVFIVMAIMLVSLLLIRSVYGVCQNECSPGDVQCSDVDWHTLMECRDDNRDGCFEYYHSGGRYCDEFCITVIDSELVYLDVCYDEYIDNPTPKKRNICQHGESKCIDSQQMYLMECRDWNNDGYRDYDVDSPAAIAAKLSGNGITFCDFGCFEEPQYRKGYCLSEPDPCSYLSLSDRCDREYERECLPDGRHLRTCVAQADGCLAWDNVYTNCEYGCSSRSAFDGVCNTEDNLFSYECTDDTRVFLGFENMNWHDCRYLYDDCHNTNFSINSIYLYPNQCLVSPGRFGYQALFDDNAHTYQSNNSYMPLINWEEGSIDFWFLRSPNVTGSDQMVIIYGAPSSGSGYGAWQIEILTNEIQATLFPYNESNITFSFPNDPNFHNRWQKLLFTWRDGISYLYLNEILVGTNTYTPEGFPRYPWTVSINMGNHNFGNYIYLDNFRLRDTYNAPEQICQDDCQRNGEYRCDGIGSQMYSYYCQDSDYDGCLDEQTWEACDGLGCNIKTGRCYTNRYRHPNCTSGTYVCDGNTLQICEDRDKDGHNEWYDDRECPNGCDPWLRACDQVFNQCDAGESKCFSINYVEGFYTGKFTIDETFEQIAKEYKEAEFGLRDDIKASTDYILRCGDIDNDGHNEWGFNDMSICRFGCLEDTNTTTNVTRAWCNELSEDYTMGREVVQVYSEHFAVSFDNPMIRYIGSAVIFIIIVGLAKAYTGSTKFASATGLGALAMLFYYGWIPIEIILGLVGVSAFIIFRATQNGDVE